MNQPDRIFAFLVCLACCFPLASLSTFGSEKTQELRCQFDEALILKNLRNGDVSSVAKILQSDLNANQNNADFWAYMTFCSDSPLDCAKKALALNPNSVIANISSGLAKTARLGEMSGIGELNKAISLRPSSLSYNARGKALASVFGHRDEAIADFSKAIQLDPKNIFSYLNRIAAYRHAAIYSMDQNEKNANLQKALKDLSLVISLRPHLAQSYVLRGQVFEAANDYDNAIANYKKAIDLDRSSAALPYPANNFIEFPESLPKSEGALWLAGRVNMQKGDWKNAIDDFSKLIESGQNAFQERAEAYKRNKQWKESTNDYASALAEMDKIAATNKLYAESPDIAFRRSLIHANKAVQHLELKDYTHAKADADKSIALLESPKLQNHNTLAIMLTNPYFTRGICNTMRGLHKAAIEDYSKAIQHVPDHSHYYLNRAASYVSLKDYKHAVEDYSKVLELAPTNALTYFHRGKCWLALNNIDKAMADFNKAGSLLPDPSTSYGIAFYRAQAYSIQGKHQQAILDLTRAIGLSDRRSADAYANRAREYSKTGDYSSAFIDLLFASSLSPKWAAILIVPLVLIVLSCFGLFRLLRRKTASS